MYTRDHVFIPADAVLASAFGLKRLETEPEDNSTCSQLLFLLDVTQIDCARTANFQALATFCAHAVVNCIGPRYGLGKGHVNSFTLFYTASKLTLSFSRTHFGTFSAQCAFVRSNVFRLLDIGNFKIARTSLQAFDLAAG